MKYKIGDIVEVPNAKSPGPVNNIVSCRYGDDLYRGFIYNINLNTSGFSVKITRAEKNWFNALKPVNKKVTKKII